jgi:hypothetical protein
METRERWCYLVPLDDHVEGDVFVASAARLDGLDAISGKLHVILGDGGGVEPDERLDQFRLG